jgi:hypothetical protein
MYEKGQKVVCISPSFDHPEDYFGRQYAGLGCQGLKYGNIYTIRDVVKWGNMIGFRLEEILNPIGLGMEEESVYDHKEFSLLDEMKHQIMKEADVHS